MLVGLKKYARNTPGELYLSRRYTVVKLEEMLSNMEFVG